MKITLTPHHTKVFTAADLADQLARWVQPGTRGTITATRTLSGGIKTLTLTIDDDPGDLDGPGPT